MAKLFSRLAGLFSSRICVGADKAGNKYFTRNEEIDGLLKEKRWVKFKGEQDPTSVPVEWICWLNGQRKIAPTPEELAEMEAKRERVKLNVALLKKEEEEKRKEGSTRRRTSTGKVGGPDLKSFIQQYPTSSGKGGGHDEEASVVNDSSVRYRSSKETVEEKPSSESLEEPTGSGQSFKPGTWKPPQ